MLHTSKFESFPLSESGNLRFDWLMIKVIYIHMTYCGPLSDLYMIVYKELYFSKIGISLKSSSYVTEI